MSPKLAARQVETMTEALSAEYPTKAVMFRQNAAALKNELAALDRELAEVLRPLKGRTFFVFHPAFGYFASEYGLKQQAVEVGGKTPSLKATVDLIAKAKADKVKVIFVQPQFSSEAAHTIAREIGGAVVPMDDLAEDYLANMRSMAASIASALGGGGASRGAP
jgi:zinc transport system substrate-binding protein